MRAIGFKNFRKFTNFPMMEFAPITIFVGGNNAGKSTVVKGLLSLTDFLKAMPFGDIEMPYSAKNRQEIPLETIVKQKKKLLKEQKFYFNTNPYTHIGTFERALNNTCDRDYIVFDGVVGFFHISIAASKPKEKEMPYGIISKIKITDLMFRISMTFDLHEDQAMIEMCPIEGLQNSEERSLRSYCEILKEPCSFTYCISDYWTTDAPNLPISLIASFNTAISYSLTIPELSEEEVADISRRTFYTPKVVEGIPEMALEAFRAIGAQPIASPFRRERESRRYIRFEMPNMRYGFLRPLNIEYIYSHAVSQNVWYVAGATDYLSKTVHEFAPMQKIESKHKIIKIWMNKDHFNIGEDFEIKSVGGEAFQVKIKDFDGSETDLADKGMGTIQLMVLLFRLAIALPSRKRARTWGMVSDEKTPQIIIVEEPEQNIHPKLQSLLADLFYEMYIDYGFRFIVETHSEYLVRKTQVFVKKLAEKTGSLVENPFNVYYFKSEDTIASIEEDEDKECPYRKMVYQEDGFFYNDFDPGFYDQSATLTRQIL